jgi:hypothetical protein
MPRAAAAGDALMMIALRVRAQFRSDAGPGVPASTGHRAFRSARIWASRAGTTDSTFGDGPMVQPDLLAGPGELGVLRQKP